MPMRRALFSPHRTSLSRPSTVLKPLLFCTRESARNSSLGNGSHWFHSSTRSLSLLPHCTGPLSLSVDREKNDRPASISPYLLLSQRTLSSGWSSRRSPYEVLGVTRAASPKDIKIAYFREAKKSHPDLHPGDAAATRRFQEVSAAYELLSDPKRKAMFDATGWAGQNTYTNAEQYTHHAEEVFRSVQGDVDVVKDALASYAEELQDELVFAAESARRGDWASVREVASAHKGLLLGVVLPVLLLLRYPPAVLAVLRLGWAGAQLAVAGLVYTGNLEVAAKMLWKQVVQRSEQQRERAKQRRRKD